MEYGNEASFWVEYPSGLVDLTRSQHLAMSADKEVVDPPRRTSEQMDISVDGGRTVRVDTGASAIVIIDMQKYSHAYLCQNSI